MVEKNSKKKDTLKTKKKVSKGYEKAKRALKKLKKLRP